MSHAGPPQVAKAPLGGREPHEEGERGGVGSHAGPPQVAKAPLGGREPHEEGERGGVGSHAGPPQVAKAPLGGREPHEEGERGGKIMLAPMEGLLDHTLRDVLTRVGGVDLCVTEFIRVTNTVLPRRAFIRVAPELLNNSRTTAGVPVRVQLLGSDPFCLADNAAALAELAPHGIDLNFGCPAKTVNQHRGGAVLLDEPELVGQIVAAVRRAVPAHIPVSAKMRLGYNDDRRAEDCAQAIEAAGASDLVVHARTKAHGYRPPAYWDRIADLRQHVRLPMVANGEIWTVADALRCREVTGCDRLMIGRGMVSDPGLALAIARHDAGLSDAVDSRAVPWAVIAGLMQLFWVGVSRRVAPRHRSGRLKQWLNYLRKVYPEAQQAFDELRLIHDPALMAQWLARQDVVAV